MLRPARMAKVRFAVYEDYVDDVLRQLGKLEVFQPSEPASLMREGEGVLSPIGVVEEEALAASIGARIDSLISRMNLEPKAIGSISLSRGPTREVLRRISAALDEVEKAYEELEAKGDRERLKEYVRSKAEELYQYRDLVEVERSVASLKASGVRASKLFVFQGWVPAREVDKVVKVIEEASNGLCIVEIGGEEEKKKGHGHGHGEEPPTLIEHRSFFTRVFQPFTTAFGYPSYKEVDPTVLMALTFPIWFGLMFGDVGHGLLLLIAALYLYYLKVRDVKVPELVRPLVQGPEILILCGITSTIVGYLFYGVVFGSHEWYRVLYPFEEPLIKLPEAYDYLVKMDPHLEEYPCPIPLGSLRAPLVMLKLSIYLAFFQIIMGLLLDAINKAQAGEYKHLVLGPGLWLWLYGTLAGLFILYDLTPGTRIAHLMADFFTFDLTKLHVKLPAPPFMLLLTPFMVMLLARIIFEEAIEGFGSSLEAFIATVSNTVSYARIFAFFLVHHAVAEIGLMPGIEHLPNLIAEGRFGQIQIAIMAFVLATLLIMTLELMVTFLQSLRLHWVEWFMKFYQGTGRKYEPFKLTLRFAKAIT